MVQQEQGSRGGNRGRKDKWLRLGEIWQVKTIGHEVWLLGMVYSKKRGGEGNMKGGGEGCKKQKGFN